MTPYSPDGFTGHWTLEDLVADREQHVLALTRHTYLEALPAAEVAEHTLALLAVSERIAQEARASGWVYATEALAAGARPGQVATAMGLRDEHALREGLRGWVAEQAHYGFMSPARQVEVLALIAEPDRAGVDAAVMAEMRAWLCDCTWADADTADIALMPDVQIIDAVERHWAGGLADFLHHAHAEQQQEAGQQGEVER